MDFIDNVFNSFKIKKITNQYINVIPDEINYSDLYEDMLTKSLIKNNIAGVEFFTKIRSSELFDRLKNKGAYNDLIVVFKGAVVDIGCPYATVMKSKNKEYTSVIIQYQFIYSEMFGVGLWEDSNRTKEKGHAFNCVLSELINGFSNSNNEIIGIGIGLLDKDQFNMLISGFVPSNITKTSNISQIKDKYGKAAVYTGVATTIGAGILLGLKVWVNSKKKK